MSDTVLVSIISSITAILVVLVPKFLESNIINLNKELSKTKKKLEAKNRELSKSKEKLEIKNGWLRYYYKSASNLSTDLTMFATIVEQRLSPKEYVKPFESAYLHGKKFEYSFKDIKDWIDQGLVDLNGGTGYENFLGIRQIDDLDAENELKDLLSE